MRTISSFEMENLIGGKENIPCIAVGLLSIIPFYALAFAFTGEYTRCFNS
jgi:hypothetical protein